MCLSARLLEAEIILQQVIDLPVSCPFVLEHVCFIHGVSSYPVLVIHPSRTHTVRV
jgi:hypothetical protein